MKIKEIEPDICGECPLIDWCGPPYETPHFCRDGRFAEMEVEEYTKLAESSICGEEDDIAEDVLERWEDRQQVGQPGVDGKGIGGNK